LIIKGYSNRIGAWDGGDKLRKRFGVFERFTEQARRAVFFARYVAGHQRAEYITTAHLLIGLAWEGKTRISEIDSLKNRIPELCALLGIPWPLGKASKKQLMADLRLNNNLKMAMKYSAEEAEMDQLAYIDTDHLLRGLLRFPNEASSALQSIHFDLPTARAVSQRHRAKLSPELIPVSMTARNSSGQVSGMAAYPFLMVAILALAEIFLILLVSWLK